MSPDIGNRSLMCSHIGIVVKDVDKAMAFYSSIWGSALGKPLSIQLAGMSCLQVKDLA